MIRKYLALFMIPLFFAASAVSAEECPAAADVYRSESLTRLFRLEKYYVTAAWHYRKAQEIVYNPLWEANIRKNDRFSKERRAEGEVHFGRYRHEADAAESQADKNARRMMREFEKLQKVWPSGIRCGNQPVDTSVAPSQASFDTCATVWRGEWDRKISEMERVLKEFQLWEARISMAAEKTLGETPSDHLKMTDRFAEYYSEVDLKINAGFQRLHRELRELLELKWPAAECCKVCAADESISVDPVFGKVKLEPSGPRGVDGETYKPSSLLEAFQNMNDEESVTEKAGS